MDRKTVILSGIDKSMLGLEIAPWFAPLVPKAGGWNSKILDIFDRETLFARAKADCNLAGRDLTVLEEVDFVGSATEIAALVPAEQHGTYDYIVSSHNFEHLPNPIRFLQGCYLVLKPGGLLVMAVPDRRHCFDYFQTNTTIGEWLEAYAEDRARPTRRQRFDNLNHHAKRLVEAGGRATVGPTDPPSRIALVNDIAALHAELYLREDDGAYHDVHCTVMTPASAELLLREAQHLGLVDLEIDRIGPSYHEFIIRLRKGEVPVALDAEAFIEVRSGLLRRILEEYREQAFAGEVQAVAVEPEPLPPAVPARPLHKRVARGVRSFGRRLRGRSD